LIYVKLMKLSKGNLKLKAYPRHTVNFSWRLYRDLCLAFKNPTAQLSFIQKFEEAFTHYLGGGEALAVASARSGLYFLLKALGVKDSDQVILPAYTFWALPLAVKLLGAEPVLVDVDNKTWNIQPDLIKKALTPKTKAVIVTHIFGEPCEMELIGQICREHGLFLIEDCAHALGSTYKGKMTGNFGEAALFSFNLGKNLPCFGGGMIVSRDRSLREKILSWAYNENKRVAKFPLKKFLYSTITFLLFHPYFFPWLVYPLLRVLDSLGSEVLEQKLKDKISLKLPKKSDLQISEGQSRTGLLQLPRLEAVNQKLVWNANFYSQHLKGCPAVALQESLPQTQAVKYYYLIRVKEREAFRKQLLRKGIDTQRDYLSDCSKLPEIASPIRFPVAESLPEQGLELPNNLFLQEKDLDYISKCVQEIAAKI
jgi:dTDP-4-amino-4,6-dideoxygalactose transaminase